MLVSCKFDYSTFNTTIMILRKLILFISTAILLTACNGGEGDGRSLSSYVSSFINDNDQVVAFGSVHLKDILDKTDYKSHDKLNAFISGEMSRIESVLDLSESVYFVGEGPLNEDGSPETLHLFIDVKNQDSLVSELNRRSYDVNKFKKIYYAEDGDFLIGVKDNLAIVTITGKDYDAKKLVKQNFNKVEGKETNEKEEEMLAEEADLVIALKLENLYGTSNTDLEKLDKATKDDLIAMAKDSYIQTKVKFENGAATIETHNHFNEKLKGQLFFRSDASSRIIEKLNKGDGELMAGVAANLDLTKMEAFYEKYSPEALDEIYTMLGLDGGLISLMGSEKLLSKLGDGQLGLAVYANQEEYAVSVNTFFGATDSGKRVFTFIQGELPEEMEYSIEKEGIYGRGGLMGESSESDNRMSIPKGCEGFGKKGITAFLNLQDFDTESFELPGSLKLFEIVDYATFEYDNDGGKLYIKAKEGQENILKQAMNKMIEQLAGNISGMIL